MEKGLVHIYTGEGKGKTTSAIGLSTRALGHGRKVCYVHFHKRPDLCGFNEIQSLEKLGATIIGITNGHPSFNRELTFDQLVGDIKNGLTKILEFMCSNSPDLVVLDEIIIAVRDGYLTEDELLQFIDQKPDKTELVLTGRGATTKLIEKADYVSNIQKIKHPFEKGIIAREGIEF